MRGRFADFLRSRRSLLVVLLLSFLLMAWGIWVRDPHVMGPDEKAAVTKALWMGVYQTPFVRDFMKGGNLYLYVLAGSFAPLYLYMRATGRIAAVTAEAQVTSTFFDAPEALQSAFYDFLLVGRFVSVLIGVGTVAVVYLLARRGYDRRTGLLSALVLAVSMGFVNTAHYATEDIVVTGLLALAYLLLFTYLDSSESRHLLSAALVSGLAISAKATAGLIVFPLFYVVLREQSGMYRRIVELVRVSLPLSAAYLLTTPSILVYPSLYVYEIQLGLLGAGNASSPPPYPGWLLHMVHLTRVLGLPLFLFVMAGVAFAGYRYSKGNVHELERLIGLFVVPYFLVIGLLIRSWEIWYVVPLLPFLAVFAGRFAIQLLFSSRDRDPGVSRHVGTLAVIVVLVFSLLYTGTTVSQFSTDSRIEATRWIESNMGESTTVDVYMYPLHLPRFPSRVTVNRYWFNGSTDPAWPRAQSRVRCRTPGYIVLTSNHYRNFVENPTDHPNIASFYRRLLAGNSGYQRVATFGPRWVERSIKAQLIHSVKPQAIWNDPRLVILKRHGTPNGTCS